MSKLRVIISIFAILTLPKGIHSFNVSTSGQHLVITTLTQEFKDLTNGEYDFLSYASLKKLKIRIRSKRKKIKSDGLDDIDVLFNTLLTAQLPNIEELSIYNFEHGLTETMFENTQISKLIIKNSKINFTKDMFKGSNINSLKILSSEIAAFSANVFEHADNLKYIKIEKCALEELNGNAFKFLVNLTLLDLSDNNIVELGPNFVRHLVDLTTLDLSYNSISELSENFFEKNRNLRNINLANNNFRYLPCGLFHYQAFISNLNLKNNKLQNLPCNIVMRQYDQLQHFDVSGNSNLPSDFRKDFSHIRGAFYELYLKTFIDENNDETISDICEDCDDLPARVEMRSKILIANKREKLTGEDLSDLYLSWKDENNEMKELRNVEVVESVESVGSSEPVGPVDSAISSVLDEQIQNMKNQHDLLMPFEKPGKNSGKDDEKQVNGSSEDVSKADRIKILADKKKERANRKNSKKKKRKNNYSRTFQANSKRTGWRKRERQNGRKRYRQTDNDDNKSRPNRQYPHHANRGGAGTSKFRDSNFHSQRGDQVEIDKNNNFHNSLWSAVLEKQKKKKEEEKSRAKQDSQFNRNSNALRRYRGSKSRYRDRRPRTDRVSTYEHHKNPNSLQFGHQTFNEQVKKLENKRNEIEKRINEKRHEREELEKSQKKKTDQEKVNKQRDIISKMFG